MSTATLPAMRATMSPEPAICSSRRLQVEVIAEDLPWVLGHHACDHHFTGATNPPAVNSRDAAGANATGCDYGDATSNECVYDEGGDINEEDQEAAEMDAGSPNLKAVRRSLAEVEMRALEGKLRLLDTQRQLSALRCQRFIHELESSLHASRSAPTTPFPSNRNPTNHATAGAAAAATGMGGALFGDADAAPPLPFCDSLPSDCYYYAEGVPAAYESHGYDLSRSLPLQHSLSRRSLSLSLSRSCSTPASLHNRLDSPRVRRAATAATPRSSRRHRAIQVSAAAAAF